MDFMEYGMIREKKDHTDLPENYLKDKIDKNKDSDKL